MHSALVPDYACVEFKSGRNTATVVYNMSFMITYGDNADLHGVLALVALVHERYVPSEGTGANCMAELRGMWKDRFL